jgi:hypothetical protein
VRTPYLYFQVSEQQCMFPNAIRSVATPSDARFHINNTVHGNKAIAPLVQSDCSRQTWELFRHYNTKTDFCSFNCNRREFISTGIRRMCDPGGQQTHREEVSNNLKNERKVNRKKTGEIYVC